MNIYMDGMRVHVRSMLVLLQLASNESCCLSHAQTLTRIIFRAPPQSENLLQKLLPTQSTIYTSIYVPIQWRMEQRRQRRQQGWQQSRASSWTHTLETKSESWWCWLNLEDRGNVGLHNLNYILSSVSCLYWVELFIKIDVILYRNLWDLKLQGTR